MERTECCQLTLVVLCSHVANENQSKALLDSMRKQLSEIRATRAEQETRVREASNLFLKVITTEL